MPTINELTPAQLAKHALNVFQINGRQARGARLIYHALKLDHYEPTALRCLSDFLAAKGTEQFSAVVLEFALAENSPIPDAARKGLDELRLLTQWSWGFARHASGSAHATGTVFDDRSQFSVDEPRYREFLNGVLKSAGSLEQAFVAAHTLCGAMGGLLTHKKHGANAPMPEVFHPDRFTPSLEYATWLASDTDELDALEHQKRLRGAK